VGETVETMIHGRHIFPQGLDVVGDHADVLQAAVVHAVVDVGGTQSPAAVEDFLSLCIVYRTPPQVVTRGWSEGAKLNWIYWTISGYFEGSGSRSPFY
jgi:hypothetical protein